MALYNLNIRSRFLKGDSEIMVIMPDKPRDIQAKDFYASGEKYKVLWLLHGGYGDGSDWIRKSMIELYACENDLVVVMPSAMNSQYSSWPNFAVGYDMYGFFFDELMPLIYGWFPVSRRREDNFIAGLSMGGGGAFKYALSNPEKFAGAAVLSWAPENYTENKPTSPLTMNLIDAYGGEEAFMQSRDNAWDLAGKAVSTGNLPKMYFGIGSDDFFFDRFKLFKAYAKEIGLEGQFHVEPGYKHEWRYWDLAIQEVLTYFGIVSGDKGTPF